MSILEILRILKGKGVPIIRRKNSIDAGNGIIEFIRGRYPIFLEEEIETEMQEQCILFLYKNNISMQDIADRFNIRIEMVKCCLEKHGLWKRPPPPRRWTRAEGRRMALMVFAGMSRKDVGEAFGVSEKRVSQLLRSNRFASRRLELWNTKGRVITNEENDNDNH